MVGEAAISRHDERAPRRLKIGARSAEITTLIVVALAYLASAKLGLSLAFRAEQVTPVWPPAGIALGAYLLFGPRVWPGIFVGAFVANATSDEPAITAVAIATGNTFGWLIAAHVARHVAKFDRSLGRIQDVFVVIGCACLGSLLAATNGSIQLALAGLTSWSSLLSVWLVWWTGDALGALIVAPAIFTWTTRVPHSWSRRGELALLFMAACVVGYAALALAMPSRYIVFPIVMWAALRFRQRDVAMTVLTIGVISVWTVARGHAPFSDIHALGMQLVFLDAFLAVVAITGFTVGATVAERSRAQRALREANERLGVLVEHRTAQLTRANRELAKAQEMARVGSWELLSDGQVQGSAELYRIIDMDPVKVGGSYAALLERMHPADREHVFARITQMLADRVPVKFDFRMHDSGGRIRTLQARGEVKTDADGRVIGVVGTLEDVTEARAAQSAIERSLLEKEVMLKEIHHRVKNNLQVVSSLLSLQAGSVADASVKALFQEANARIRSIALIHENLYQAENLASIDAGHYLDEVTSGLVQSYGARANVTCNAEGIELTIGTAIPCGLIVTELVSNALKHAFPDDRRGNVVVSLTEDPSQHLLLEISDDGVGIPAGIDIKATKTMGLQVVHRLAAQLHAIVEVDRRAGTTFRFRFPRPS